MNLDDTQKFSSIDLEHMLDHIVGLPDQLQKAWELGSQLPLVGMQPIKRVVVAGMGGSAIGADLLASYLSDRMMVPMSVHRDYDLPAYANGGETLVVVSSHSGNTEESLSAFTAAVKKDCQIVAITTGGKLVAEAQKSNIPCWLFTHKGQPRAAVGFSFGLLLALFVRLGLVSDPSDEVRDTISAMKELRKELEINVPVKSNPAKRLAGQLVGRHITVFGSGFMIPVARRWKCQFNEVAKAIASFEAMPEADHNTLAGISYPEETLDKEIALFLQAPADHPRDQRRVEKTREIMMVEGLNTDLIIARGKNRLEQIWTTVLLGDFMAYYLAMMYEVDPTPIAPILKLKEAMSQ